MAQQLPERKDIPQSDTWNLAGLYPSWEAWRRELEQLESRLGEIESFRGHLADSPQHLLRAVQLILDFSQVIDRLHTFARVRSDEDLRNTEHLGNLQRATSLAMQVSALGSFFRPELLAIPEDKLKTWLEQSEFSPYRRYISDIIRYRPHTLTPDEERMLALAGEALNSTEKVFSQLTNSDFDFGTIDIEGKPTQLTHGTFQLFVKHPDREIRRQAYQRYYAEYDAHKNTLAASLTGALQTDVFVSRARKYNSSIGHALFGENIDPAVYTNLINSVSGNLKPLHSYYQLRKKKLGLETQHIYDTYVPLVPNAEISISFDRATEYLLEALQPLGDEYVSVLRKGLTTDRWVDRYENLGKNSGAYSSGCYDSPPYILMNYREGDIRHVFTLAHEAGHSMHSYFSRKHQSYQDSDYSIFVAEVASTFNEALLNAHLRKVFATDPKVRLFLVNQQIDDIKATLFRQTMFAEFEKITHEKLEAHEPVTLDTFREIYAGLLQKYFGPSITLIPEDSLEFSRIPHFYWAFYVYKYATGIAAALTLAERTLAGDQESTKRYLTFLRSGGSKYSLDLLRDAGVDMLAPTAVESALAYFSTLVNDLEKGLTA